MDEKAVHELIRKKQAEDSIRQEFEGTLADRVARYLEVKPHEIVPYTHFSAISAECSLLFRDGHYYGCIALTQAVAEALVRFLCTKNTFKPVKKFEENVRKLSTRTFISDKVKESLLKIWEGRDDYHHLNTSIENDRQTLEELAREKTRLLVEVERDVFRFTIVDCKINPENRKYWDISSDQMQVFLRLDP
jgi:hypothetical protein